MRAAPRTFGSRKRKSTLDDASLGSALLTAENNAQNAQESVKAERTRLIEERRSELARVLDRHDDLLREAFHLQEFKMMVSYDPKVAKTDTSDVFAKFKAKHDLLDSTPTAGPSRTTRRSRTERMEALQVASTSAPPAAANDSHDNDMVWKLLSEAKAGNRRRGKTDPVSQQSISAAPAYSRKGKGKATSVEEAHSTHTIAANGSGSISAHSRLRSAMAPPPEQPLPRKKRKINHSAGTAAIDPGGTSDSLPQSNGSGSASPPETQLTDKLRNTRANGKSTKSLAESIIALPLSPPSPPSSPLKRVKLIVKKPQPTLTHPAQRFPTPKYESLTALLSSYRAPDDVDLDDKGLRALIRDDVKIWRKIDALRREGRMLYRPPDTLESLEVQAGLDEARKPDVWDAVLAAVADAHETRRVSGPKVAAQVALRVRAYWDSRAVREDKAKAVEERRLRALAKATIRMVTAEWKKAVFHIREQERLRREAEERRRGHEHLDALLDQSEQLLEAQQEDLTKRDISKSRSRSSSLAETLSRWASASPPPDEVDASDDDHTEGEESDSETEAAEERDPAFLVPGSKALAESPAAEDEEDIVRLANSSPTRAADPEDPDEGFNSIPSEKNSSRHHSPAFDVPRRLVDAPLGDSPQKFREPSTPSKDRLWNAESPVQATPLTRSNGRMSIMSLLDHDSGLEASSSGRSSSGPSFGHHQYHPSQLHPTTSNADPSWASGVASSPILTHESIDIPPSTPDPGLDVLEEEESAEPSEPATPLDDQDVPEEEVEEDVASIPTYLRPYAVAPVEWDPQQQIKPPLLLRGNLRPYQHAGLEWLASLHANNTNGILADEMGLGKTIQTISLLAHLACDRGIWGPHLIIVPTSVLLNWEMEFKKFLPGFKVLSYHGNAKRRKELRQGWNNKYHFNVCVTSYTLASRDAHVFKRKAWYYMILDEAHMIKNFKSQRWNILLMFRSFRRLLLTGTPLQNNLTELWALLQFLMSGTNFANLKEFGDWFANPLEKAIEMGTVMDDETQQRVAKLHSVLRPYLLRRLKRDVEKELPSKFEHLIMCPLSKRQRFLYDEFMSRADTRHDLQSGVYQKIANILMQLRKVVNHPDLFEVRPIRTSFAMSRAAVADYEIKELLVRRRLLQEDHEQQLDLDLLGLRFIDRQNTSMFGTDGRRRLDASTLVPLVTELPDPPPRDVRTIAGFRKYKAYMENAVTAARWAHIHYLNRLRCHQDDPLLSEETIRVVKRFYKPLLPYCALDRRLDYLNTSDRIHQVVKSYAERADSMAGFVDRFAFVTPAAVVRDLPNIALAGHQTTLSEYAADTSFDAVLHRSSVKLQIAFPDPSLLQYDCGKLQELARLLRERKAGGHRILIFTQMTRILDILEIFLNLHGYLYLRLDGATKIEDRQYITERFNTDPRIFCFISSSRSGGVGINLTGADTVIFYDSDFNPQMDRQCEDRAHRIGQIRDVHIYRFISSHTVEEALLRKANQKRSLDDLVIQKGEFDWRTLFGDDGAGAAAGLGVGTVGGSGISVSALERALGEFEDSEDRRAREIATMEEVELVGADEADFGGEGGTRSVPAVVENDPEQDGEEEPAQDAEEADAGDGEEEGGTTVDYMLAFVQADMEFFSEWKI